MIEEQSMENTTSGSFFDYTRCDIHVKGHKGETFANFHSFSKTPTQKNILLVFSARRFKEGKTDESALTFGMIQF